MPLPDLHIPTLSETDFWNVVQRLDWDASTRQQILAPAVEALAQYPESAIRQFEDIMAQKLFLLDTAAHAQAAYPQQRISVDGFLYIRAAAVAAGREAYEYILQHPQALNPNQDFEPLLYLAAEAFERKTGQPFTYVSPVSYETYANESGWL